jgi:hypothetical protein
VKGDIRRKPWRLVPHSNHLVIAFGEVLIMIDNHGEGLAVLTARTRGAGLDWKHFSSDLRANHREIQNDKEAVREVKN